MSCDFIALNFSKELDSTDCSMWVMERCNHFKFLVFDNIKRIFRRFAFIQVNIFFLRFKSVG